MIKNNIKNIGGIGVLNDIEKSGNPYLLADSYFNNLFKLKDNKITCPRPSTFYDACMRMHVICTKLKIVAKIYHNQGELLNFAIGNAVHNYIQNTSNFLGENRYGYWKCSSCNSITKFGPLPKVKCNKCGAGNKAYSYYEFRDKIDVPYSFSFHIDMFRKIDDFYRIDEFKTIKKEAWEKLKAPLISHEYQIHLYIMGIHYSKKFTVKFDPNISYVHYIPKGYIHKGIPIKSFVIKTNKHIITNIKNKLQLYKDGIVDYPKHIPQLHGDCTKDINCWRARMCPARKECKRLL